LSHDFIAELKLKEEGEFQNVKDGKKSILEIYEILLRNDEDKDTGGKEKKRQRQLSSSSLLKKALKMYELIICYNYELQQSIHESSSLESCSVFYLYKKFVTHNGVSNHLVIDFFRQIIVDAARLKIIIDEDNLVEDDDSGRQRLYYDLYSLFKTDLFNDLGNNPVNKPDNCLSAGNYGHQLLAVSKCIDVFKFSKFILAEQMKMIWKGVVVDNKTPTLIYSLIAVGGPTVSTIFDRESSKLDLDPLNVENALQKWKNYREEIMEQICLYFPRDLACIIFEGT
jgi:hypothetical protein